MGLEKGVLAAIAKLMARKAPTESEAAALAAARAAAPEQKMLQGVYRGYAGDLPETVYHAGADFAGAARPGLFVTKDREAAQRFLQATGAPRLHTFEMLARRGGGESEIVDMAKRMGIYEEGLPVGQYLEQGENAIFPESAAMVEELHNLGLDHLVVNDGMSKVPSVVVLDPAALRRSEGLFASPQRAVAEYYAKKRAAQTGESPHVEMLLIDPASGAPYNHATMGTGAQPPIVTRARKLAPEDVRDRTQLYRRGGLAQLKEHCSCQK